MARTVTVAMGPHYEEFIQANIAGGRYNNASEVIRAALRHLEAFMEEMKAGWRRVFLACRKLGKNKIRIVRILHERRDYSRHL